MKKLIFAFIILVLAVFLAIFFLRGIDRVDAMITSSTLKSYSSPYPISTPWQSPYPPPESLASGCNVVLAYCNSAQQCGDPLFHTEVFGSDVWKDFRICEAYFFNGQDSWRADHDLDIYLANILSYRIRGIGTKEIFIQRMRPDPFPRIQEVEIKIMKYNFDYLPSVTK